MKQYRMLLAFIAILVGVTLACVPGNDTPTPVPTPTPAPTKALSQPQPPATPVGNTTVSSDLVTWTDQSDLLAFDLPGNWTYEQYTEEDLYIDKFASPDETAFIDSLVFYNNGSPVNSGYASLYMLNNYYSYTGKEGDIRVTEDKIMKDGSERLTWFSKGGNYSGVSFLEIRGKDKSTFLLFTAYWADGVDQDTLDTVNNAIASYRVP